MGRIHNDMILLLCAGLCIVFALIKQASGVELVGCDLHGLHSLQTVKWKLVTGTCAGTLQEMSDDLTDYMTLHLKCPQHTDYNQEFACREHIVFDTDEQALLAEETTSLVIHCWIFRNVSGKPNTKDFMVLPAAQCNGNTWADVVSGKTDFLFQGQAVLSADTNNTSTESPDEETTTTSEITPAPDNTNMTSPTANTSDVTSLPGMTSLPDETSTDSVTTHQSTTRMTEVTPDVTTNGTDEKPSSTTSGSGAGRVIGIIFGTLIGIILVGVVVFLGWRFYTVRRQPYRIL